MDQLYSAPAQVHGENPFQVSSHGGRRGAHPAVNTEVDVSTKDLFKTIIAYAQFCLGSSPSAAWAEALDDWSTNTARLMCNHGSNPEEDPSTLLQLPLFSVLNNMYEQVDRARGSASNCLSPGVNYLFVRIPLQPTCSDLALN